MDKTVESHIPINLRRWLDEQIEREMTDCAPLGFHGLLTALTEAPPEDSPLRLVSTSNSPSYEARFPT